MKTSRINQLAAWAGMIAPVLFVATFTIEGVLRPGYEPMKTYVSALSLGPRGWIQIANFILFGLLMLVFARQAAAEFPTGKASRGGTILFVIIACLYFISGPFVMDPTGTPQSQMTVHGIIHGLAGGIVFILMPVTCFVFLRRFRADPAWRAFSGWTLAIGIIVAAAAVALTITSKSPSLMAATADWQGLIQRFIIVPFMLWVFLFAYLIYRKIGRSAD